MKKMILILLVILINTSYTQQNKLITNNSIGVFELNKEFPNDYDKEIFDITQDSNNKIKSIIVFSKDYKTKEGFGIGSNIEDIKTFYKSALKKPLSLNKGNIMIGSLGIGVIYKNITFVDDDDDEKIDFVIIQDITKN